MVITFLVFGIWPTPATSPGHEHLYEQVRVRVRAVVGLGIDYVVGTRARVRLKLMDGAAGKSQVH